MIKKLTVKNIRGIRAGMLDELTEIVVLVGPNASGKSTLLDALLVGGSAMPGDAIARAVRRRPGQDGPEAGRWLLWRAGDQGGGRIEVESSAGVLRAVSLTPITPQLRTIRYSISDLEDGADLTAEAAAEPSGSVTFGSGQESLDDHIAPLAGVPEVRLIHGLDEIHHVPLDKIYSQAVVRGRATQAKNILSRLLAQETGLEILTESEAPTLFAVFKDGAVPVALVGDGVHALIRLSLELSASPSATMLLEEPEIHLDPRAVRDCASAIVSAADEGLQIILATHSLDLIDALIAAAHGNLERLSVYRLSLDGGELRVSRIPGGEAAFARTDIQDDLR